MLVADAYKIISLADSLVDSLVDKNYQSECDVLMYELEGKMKKPTVLIISMIVCLITRMAMGATTLSAGDIAIFGVNTDTPKDFGFVLLVDIEIGTEIRFTDSGWLLPENTFRGNEGAIKYTAPSALTAGTEITLVANSADFVSDNDTTVGTSNFVLSASGDQIFAFQGESTSPTFIYAIQTNSNEWQATSAGSNDSAIPQGLTNGVNAVAVGFGAEAGDEYDNAAYDKSTMSGTESEILSAISKNSNWVGDNSTLYDLTTYNFSITGAAATPTITLSTSSLSGFSYYVGSGPSAEQSFTISGSDLTANISITPPTNYEISTGTGASFSATNPITLTQSGGTVSETTIYVRLKAGLSEGSYKNETITASSTDAINKTVTCSGMVSYAPMAGADYVEDFTNSAATSSYLDGSFVGNNGITWNYIHARNENGDDNNSGIDGNALMLRRVADGSKIYSSPVPGGIADFYVRLYKGFTAGGNRQVELFINDISKGTSIAFDDFDEHNFTVSGINISGDVVIELRNTTASQIIVDDISWTSYDANYVQEEIATSTNVSQAFTGTNVTLEFGEVTTGANVRVSKYSYAPQNVSFGGTVPTNYSDYKWIINAGNLAFSDGVIKIAVAGLSGITDPGTVDIYKRSTPGIGDFSKLTTGYADGFLSATVSSFSEFILGSDDEDNSLPVELQDFNAVPGNSKVTLNWSTESETENLGFNIYRGVNKNGEFLMLNAELIPGHGSTSEMQEYTYIDRNVVNGVTYFYKLEDVDYAGKTELHNKVVSAAPTSKESDTNINEFRLYPCYPNPFNPSTNIRIALHEPAPVKLQVYNLNGKLISTLLNTSLGAGEYNFTWNATDFRGTDVASGVYFIRMVIENQSTSLQKVLLVR